MCWYVLDRFCGSTATARRTAAVMAGTQLLSTVKKSPLDARAYRAIELPNKMRALLISDPTTDMSAAALSVAAGKLFYLITIIYYNSNRSLITQFLRSLGHCLCR